MQCLLKKQDFESEFCKIENTQKSLEDLHCLTLIWCYLTDEKIVTMT